MAKKKVLGYRVKILDYGETFYARRDRSFLEFHWLRWGRCGKPMTRAKAEALRDTIARFAAAYEASWKDTLKIVKVVSRG